MMSAALAHAWRFGGTDRHARPPDRRPPTRPASAFDAKPVMGLFDAAAMKTGHRMRMQCPVSQGFGPCQTFQSGAIDAAIEASSASKSPRPMVA